MDFQELLNTLANQVAFWQGKNDRYNVPVVNEARNVTRDIGRTADTYVGGGMGQAALRGPDALSRQILLNAALLAAGEGASYGIGKGIQAVAPKISPKLQALRNFLSRNLLPQEVGLHHSVTGVDGLPFTGNVRTSVRERGLTAFDQKPGYSYFWNTGKGKPGINEALNEIKFQTELISDRVLLDEGQKAAGYVTRVPRGLSREDENVLGSIAREIPREQKVVGSVTGTGKKEFGMVQFSEKDLNKLGQMIQDEKRKELLKSIAKISGVSSPLIGGTTYGVTRK